MTQTEKFKLREAIRLLKSDEDGAYDDAMAILYPLAEEGKACVNIRNIQRS